MSIQFTLKYPNSFTKNALIQIHQSPLDNGLEGMSLFPGVEEAISASETPKSPLWSGLLL